MFIVFRVVLVALLLNLHAKVYISFDLWTSPNRYFMLGLVCHFINQAFKACTILLSLKALHGPYSGENIATHLVQIIKDYNLQTRLGFYILDNTRDNSTLLLAIS